MMESEPPFFQVKDVGGVPLGEEAMGLGREKMDKQMKFRGAGACAWSFTGFFLVVHPC